MSQFIHETAQVLQVTWIENKVDTDMVDMMRTKDETLHYTAKPDAMQCNAGVWGRLSPLKCREEMWNVDMGK